MAKHEYYVVQGKTLDNVAETMKTVLGVDKDTPIRFDEITNNEKVEQITENVDVQAEVIEQIKAALNGKSSIGVKEIMEIIDQSGVLESTDGTATEKVRRLIDKAEQEEMLFKTSKYLTINNTRSPFYYVDWTYPTIPKIDFSEQTSLVYAFCSPSLEYFEHYINSSKCTNFSFAFASKNIKRIKGVDTSSATSVREMFYGGLEVIEEPLNLQNVIKVNGIYAFCQSLVLREIRFVSETIKVSIDISSPVLSDESIQSIIDGLAIVETAQTLTLHADVKAKLTEEQLTTITSKNWNLA